MKQNRRDTILIVDDREGERAALREVLEGDYNLLEAENPRQAMLLLEEYRTNIAVVLLPLTMALRDGRLLLEEVSERGFLGETPVVAIGEEQGSKGEMRAFDLGASDFVRRPVDPDLLGKRVRNIADLCFYRRHMEELVEERAQNLRESNEALTDALTSIIEYRNLESGQHVLHIRMFTKLLLRDVARNCPEYDLDERTIHMISQAASMHDIGKIAIPDSILNKPGKLTDEEFAMVKTHTLRGCNLLATISGLGDREYLGYAYRICRYHHERWDGNGYIDGIKGENIPICAQVVGIVDCYDALTTDRVYKKAYTHEKAVNMILNGECGAFSPRLLECFKNVRSQFQELAREYGASQSTCVKLDLDAVTRELPAGLDTPQMAQTKYFLLLRHMGCTVIEADVDHDIYHMVYAPDDDFDVLRTGGMFREALNEFYRTCVHPEDRGQVEENGKGYLERFFRKGLLKKAREYRVLRKSVGAYHWYRCTTLRVDTENPHRHRAILIWQDLGPEWEGGMEPLPKHNAGEAMCRNIPGVVFQCRNDAELTVLQWGEGFPGMFGYTEQELNGKIHGSFLQMVCMEDRKALQDGIARQLFHGNLVECEVRMRCANGAELWVMGKFRLVQEEGEECFYCILVDITGTRRSREELRLSLERHQIIMDQTNDIIFEWDIPHDHVTYSPNWEKKFGYSPLRDKYAAQLHEASHIHPDDIKNMMGLVNQIKEGLPYAETEYRLAKANGHYIWCRVRATTQVGADGKPVKAIGVILDIDKEKRRAVKLQERAERDALTGLYNKAAARQRMEQVLRACAGTGISALLMLDVDNFKQINDCYGHMCGDAVLTQLAEQIRGIARNGDVISRIGGDEFLIFLTGLTRRAEAITIAERFIQAIRETVPDRMEACGISCSVGIAYAPEHGSTFRELFQRADTALYQAKHEGKNCVRVYTVGDMEQFFGSAGRTGRRLSALGAHIDSDEERDIDEIGLLQYTFQRLYQSEDMNESINAILKLAGEKFNVSRAYIFENTEDGQYCRNTFEWCNKGVLPQKSQLLIVSYQEDLGDNYLDYFNENGIFYCLDIAQLPSKQSEVLLSQGTKSVLQCAIMDRGEFRGYVGFDENSVNRLWTQDQIDALVLLSELLSVFLLKRRAQEKAETMAQDLRSLLDKQNTWIYVIDPETYELFYMNEKALTNAPEAKVGMTCYKAFFDRDRPCEHCPAKGIRGKMDGSMQRYNPALKVWSEMGASLVKWGDKDACLLTCHNITSFKERKDA